MVKILQDSVWLCCGLFLQTCQHATAPGRLSKMMRVAALLLVLCQPALAKKGEQPETCEGGLLMPLGDRIRARCGGMGIGSFRLWCPTSPVSVQVGHVLSPCGFHGSQFDRPACHVRSLPVRHGLDRCPSHPCRPEGCGQDGESDANILQHSENPRQKVGKLPTFGSWMRALPASPIGPRMPALIALSLPSLM